jgi:hypothetical protein
LLHGLDAEHAAHNSTQTKSAFCLSAVLFTQTTTQVSSALVSLAGLISSVLIVNQMHAINSHCINGLFNAACILQSLGTDEITRCSLPHLLLVIRDQRLEFQVRWLLKTCAMRQTVVQCADCSLHVASLCMMPSQHR